MVKGLPFVPFELNKNGNLLGILRARHLANVLRNVQRRSLRTSSNLSKLLVKHLEVFKLVRTPLYVYKPKKDGNGKPLKKNSTIKVNTRAKGDTDTKVSNSFHVLSNMIDMNDECGSNTSNRSCKN